MLKNQRLNRPRIKSLTPYENTGDNSLDNISIKEPLRSLHWYLRSTQRAWRRCYKSPKSERVHMNCIEAKVHHDN